MTGATDRKPKPKGFKPKKFKLNKQEEITVTGDGGFTGATFVSMSGGNFKWEVENPPMVISDTELKVKVTPRPKSTSTYGNQGRPRETDDVTVTVTNPDGSGTAPAESVVVEP